MKKLLKPFIQMATNYYEGTTLTKVPRSRSRKARKYEHVDIQKDFERRQKDYQDDKKRILDELYGLKDKQITHKHTEATQTAVEKAANMDVIELGEVQDLKSKYLIGGVRKMCILGVIKYHQLSHHLFEDSTLHPETQKKLEELHYLVEHNLPVEKEMIFTMVPELFRYEINQLQAQDRLLFPTDKKAFTRADGNVLEVDSALNKLELENSEDRVIAKLMNMEHYVLDQSRDIYNTYRENISEYLIRNNYADFYSYYTQLKVMDEDKMLPWEKSFLQEVNELKGIKEDIKALWTKVHSDIINSTDLPDWVITDKSKKMFKEILEYANKYQTLDIRDTILIPPTPNTGPSFDERLRIATGGKIDDFIETERHEFKRLANERMPIEMKDINDKDDNLIRKMNIVAQAVVVEDPPLSVPDPDDILEEMKEGMYGMLSQDHRVLRDEIYKVLFLNNQNPEIYNVKFWSNHFKIDPAAIRNMFNYLAYPIVDQKSKTVVKILYFIDMDIVRNREKLQDITREDYSNYLEEDYYRRLEIEQQEMNQALGQTKSLRQLFIEKPIILAGKNENEQIEEASLKIKASSKIEEILDKDTIMDDLDKEIMKYKEMHETERSKKKNQMGY